MAKNQWLNVHVLTILAVVVALVSVIRASDVSDFRVFDFGDEDTEFFSSSAYEKAFNDHESYFPTDLNLGALDLIAATPHFAKLPSYVDPSEVEVARRKRKAASSEEEEQSSEDDEDDEKSDSSGGPDGYVDRYEQFVSRHFKNRDEQRQKDDTKGDGANYSYRFDYSPSDDYERIKQESEAQSRQLAKDPKNCKAYEQDGMLCHACRDPDTDTTSESCAYATVPHHKKFAYVKQKNYNSKDHDKEADKEEDYDEASREDNQESEDDDEDVIEVTTKAPAPIKQRSRVENISNLPQNRKVIPTKKSVVHVKPGQGAPSNGGGYRYQPVDMRSNKQKPQPVEATAGIVHPTYYDFYTHFFPSTGSSGAAGRSQKIQQQEPAHSEDVYVLSYRDKDQVAKVLADFESRDWSNCKKGNKNELTCYTCTDKEGVKHEECMYLSESRQISSQVRPPSPSGLPPAVPVQPTESKKSNRRKKVQKETLEKKPISPKLRKVRPKTAANKSAKLQLDEDMTRDGGSNKGLERQTVKRTVSIKAHVDGGDGLAPMDGERVVHYEHHVSHRL